MKINKNVSRMQTEVWKMKDKIYAETKKMKSREFFKYINDKCKLPRSQPRQTISTN